MSFAGRFIDDFTMTAQRVYEPASLVYSTPEPEAESAEYGACQFDLGGSAVLFRVAKITPTKIGQFVTIWKRDGNGPIAPYDLSDLIDYFVICTRDGARFGQFVFPKAALAEKDIVSTHGKGGKRAIRVYPPWDHPVAPQAVRTQKWQLKYFLHTPENGETDLAAARRLYSHAR